MERFPGSHEPSRSEAQAHAYEAYLETLPLTEAELDGPLLDVGTDDGAFVGYLRKERGNEQAVGVELQEHKLEAGQEGVVVASGFELPFGEGSFKTVIARNYLPMFVDKPEKMEEAIAELIRVADNEGRVLGDVALPEGERVLTADYGFEISEDEDGNATIRSVNEGNTDVEGSGTFFLKRYEGAKKLAAHLESLKSEHGIELLPRGNLTTLVLTKGAGSREREA